MLTNYNCREKRFGRQCLGERPAQQAFSFYCEVVGVDRDERINNMWARKSFANTTLGVLQLPTGQVMATTGHRSELVLREFYHPTSGIHQEPLWTSTVAFAPLCSWHTSSMEPYPHCLEPPPKCIKRWWISLFLTSFKVWLLELGRAG